MFIIVLELEVVVLYVKYFFVDKRIDGKEGDMF